jgi:uncharacterized protein (DUF1015 family)
MYLGLMRKEDKTYSPAKSYNYLMTYFTPIESEGLYVMPIHRIIKSDIDFNKINNIFKADKINSAAELEEKLEKSPKNKCIFGLYYRRRYFLLEFKDKKASDKHFKDKKCFRDLDVAVLDFYIFAELLKIKKDDIMYTKEIAEAKDLIDNGIGKAVFILRQIHVKKIKDVALCGEKMPPKSTYFYPKLLSGLVVHRFE